MPTVALLATSNTGLFFFSAHYFRERRFKHEKWILIDKYPIILRHTCMTILFRIRQCLLLEESKKNRCIRVF